MLRKINICIGVLVGIVLIAFLVKVFPFGASFFDQTTTKDGPMPNNGLWYCKELQIQLCFIPIEYAPDLTLEEYETYTYIITEEGCIMCGIRIPVRGSVDLSIFAQDSEYREILGKTFFHGLCKSLDDTCYTIQGDDGVEYQFLKIDEFSVQTYLENHNNQADVLHTNKTEPKHIQIAANYAVDLWKSQLGLTDNIGVYDLRVSFDPNSFYWLVSLPQSESVCYFALVSVNGDYLSIWTE